MNGPIAHIKNRSASRGARFISDESGAPTVEFVVIFPFLLSMFLWMLETGYLAFHAVQLDRGLDITSRDLAINGIPDGLTVDQAYEQIRDSVWENGLMRGCADNLKLELYAHKSTDSFTTSDISCVNRTSGASTTPIVNAGNCTASDQMIEMRACLLYDPVMPVGLTYFQKSDADTDAVQITSRSIFFNEPCQ